MVAGMILLKRYVHLDPEVIATFGYPAIFLANILTTLVPMFPMPSSPIIIIAGSMLNPALVALAAGAGMTTGLIGPFVLGATGKSKLEKTISGKRSLVQSSVVKVTGWFKHHGLLTAFLLAATPIPLFDYASVVAGATGMPFHKFFLGSLLGKILQTTVLAFSGFFAASWLANI
jgi:membrane protein DedA with SNARE-associated domain